MRKYHIVLILALLSLAVSCKSPFPKSKGADDQNLVAVREEFNLNKFDNVLSLIDQNSGFFSTNARTEALQLRARALEHIVRKLNTDPLNLKNDAFRHEAAKKYKPFDVRMINDKFFYLGADYLALAHVDKAHAGAWYARYIDLNDPFLDKDLNNAETVQEFGRIIGDTIDEMRNGKKNFSSRARMDVLNTVRSPPFRLAGMNTTLSNINRKYVDRLMQLCDAMIESSPEKAEIVNSYFIKMSLSRMGANRNLLRSISEEMIKKYPNDKNSAFAYYVQGKFAYRSGNPKQALVDYNKALQLLAEYTPGKQGFNELLFYDFPDASHLRQDIINRIGVVESEQEYQELLKTADVAVIAGNTVRLRKTMDSGTARNIITSLSIGDKVILLKRSPSRENIDSWQDYWYYVRTRNGSEGWIFGKYLIIF